MYRVIFGIKGNCFLSVGGVIKTMVIDLIDQVVVVL